MHQASHLLIVLLALSTAPAWLSGCVSRDGVPVPATLSLVDRIDGAQSAAAHFLLERQDLDGCWRSEIYGPFKDGASLTPLVVQALLRTPAGPERDAACRRAIAYLASCAQADGTVQAGPHGFSYPLYTAAGALTLLSAPDQVQHRRARDVWLVYLRQRQLTEDLGWQPADKEYGGWGYCPGLPRKLPAGQLIPPLTESNLSATVAALEALRAAGCPADDAAVGKALTFVQRCQNYGDDATFDDGGFFFIYDDGVRNKAGVAGKDRQGRERYSSYGSTTGDGLRALLLCGLPPEHPRVVAARRWLETHFSATTHPGRYAPEREPNRQAVYHYYAYSAAQALEALALQEVTTPAGRVRWAEALAEQLLKDQRDDGSWVNSVVLVREDDPLVATALATQALAVCRSRLASQASGKALTDVWPFRPPVGVLPTFIPWRPVCRAVLSPRLEKMVRVPRSRAQNSRTRTYGNQDQVTK
jgi:squalene-hopene/tetraprenyl-beta-curcumene cyclase